MQPTTVVPSDIEFLQFQRLIEDKTGIFLPVQKKTLLNSRLSKRVVATNSKSYTAYFKFITSHQGGEELQRALELITTNETYFFRERKHFDFLRERVLPVFPRGRTLRIWSAAASTGEEPYSIAMELSTHCVSPWEILASDINSDVLRRAERAIYLDERTSGITPEFRQQFCRRGIGEFSGHLRLVPIIRESVTFRQLNLTQPFPDIGTFDVIFIRNVMIYFERATQQDVVRRLYSHLNPHGYLFIGHSESLHSVSTQFRSIQPAIYQRIEV
jgi:chemotaxis protein methyltransferase CheR